MQSLRTDDAGAMIRISFKAALFWLVMSSASFAQSIIDGSDPRAVLELARGYGSAALETLNNGDPNIIGRIDGIGYAVHFLNCTNNSECGSLNFYSAFADVKPSAEQINAWNSSKRYGRAYLDADMDAAIEMDVNLSFGVTSANLDASFALWRLVLTQYVAHVGLGQSGQ